MRHAGGQDPGSDRDWILQVAIFARRARRRLVRATTVSSRAGPARALMPRDPVPNERHHGERDARRDEHRQCLENRLHHPPSLCHTATVSLDDGGVDPVALEQLHQAVP